MISTLIYGLVAADEMNSKKEYYDAVAEKRSDYKKMQKNYLKLLMRLYLWQKQYIEIN
jgi:hypothetical protein